MDDDKLCRHSAERDKYKTLRVNYSQEAAAAKTGISVASARRIESMAALPS